MSEVGHQDEEPSLQADGITDRLGGIVRDDEAAGLDAAGDFLPLPGRKVPPAAAHLQMGKGVAEQGFVQGRGRPYRP